MAIPFRFLGTLTIAPFVYRVEDKYCKGTPEWDERVSKIRVSRRPGGLGVIVEYPEG